MKPDFEKIAFKALQDQSNIFIDCRLSGDRGGAQVDHWRSLLEAAYKRGYEDGFDSSWDIDDMTNLEDFLPPPSDIQLKSLDSED